MTLDLKRILPLLVALAAILTLAAVHAPAASAYNPCDGDTPPSSCFDTHTETQGRTLTVTRSAGTVTSSPAGISCGATCTTTFDATRTCDYYDCSEWVDPSVTLTATGGPSGFAPSWSGCAASGSTCSLTLDAAKSVNLGWADVTDPTVGLYVNSAGGKVGPTAIVSATASDNAGVQKVEFLVDGVVKATDTAAPYAAALDMSSYADGSSHAIAARATDVNGRTSAPSTATRTVDRHVGLTVGSVAADVAAIPSPAIATDADATMQCALDGGTAATCSGTYAPAGLTEGDHTYAVTATDDVGNSATVLRAFTYDPTAPAVAFTDGPGEGQTVATRSATIAFTATDARLAAVTCKVDGGAAGPCSTASTQALSGLADGQHTLTVAATDRAGNRTERTRTFAVSVPSAGGTGTGSTPPAQTPAAAAPSAPAAEAQTAAKAQPKASLTAKSRRKGSFTVFTTLKLTSLPAGAKVAVTCKGGGCPKTVKSLSALLGRKLRPGALVTIRISASGAAPRTIRVTVRRGAAPKVA